MIPRFFCPIRLTAGATIELPETVAHHALRVLRMQSGDRLAVFNGDGGEYPARLEADGRRARALLGDHLDEDRESTLDITLVQSLPSGEKMDWVVQKAVELGVRTIAPVVSARSVVKLSGERARKREEHWRQVAISACEQSGRNRLPSLLAVQDLGTFLSQSLVDREAVKLLLFPGGERRLRAGEPGARVVLLVGPEGGLTEGEAAAALASGFERLSLGPRVLRTETAGLAVLAALGALYGDL